MSANAASFLRTQVLGGYRRLLKASQIAFRGDLFAIGRAKIALRENFLANAKETDLKEIEKMIQGIEEAESMLLHNIVQGKQVDSKQQGGDRIKYEVKLTDPQRQHMRKDEEIIPITEKTAEQEGSIVINSGNVCRRA